MFDKCMKYRKKSSGIMGEKSKRFFEKSGESKLMDERWIFLVMNASAAIFFLPGKHKIARIIPGRF